jgi:hypothetical protein
MPAVHDRYQTPLGDVVKITLKTGTGNPEK